MKTQNYTRPPLDDVLEQYVAHGPSYEALNDFARRFPEYRKALADFTIQWSAMEHADPDAVAEDDPDIEATLEIVRGLLRQGTTTTDFMLSAEPSDPPSRAASSVLSLTGDTSEGPTEAFEEMLARLDIDLSDFEDQSGLDYSVLINLSMGGFTFASSDERDSVARALLGHIRAFDPDAVPSLPAVRRSITTPPMIAAGQSLSPENKPRTVTKPFRRGIEDARGMTDEAKAKWLRILDEA